MSAEKPEAYRLTANEFANETGADGSRKFAFGVSGEKTASALRRLADAVERGEVLLNDVRVMDLASNHEFTCKTLRLKLYEVSNATAAQKLAIHWGKDPAGAE